MGFLTDGNTLTWEEVKKVREYIRKHGILQFLAIYEKTKNRSNDCLKFGDEIEYVLLSLDDKEKKAKLSMRAAEILEVLMREELEGKGTAKTLWRPEYARYMVEGTPGAPYGDCMTELRRVELNMQLRRQHVQQQLLPHERIVSLSVFPLMGVGSFTDPPFSPQGPVAQSLFTPDEIIFQHKRFPTLSQNIRERRGSKVCIQVPIYRDERTVQPLPTAPGGDEWSIYMDSMAFGMGMCCLQTTFQCEDINEARKFYDQLAMMSPIMLALTASSPIYRGFLSDIDVRWAVISAAVDDRTPEERGLKPLEHDKFVINKSRYDSIDCFISTDEKFKPEYNDLDLVYDKEVYAQLREGGIDDLLARHLAHLFIRDPLVVYDDKIELDDTQHSDHFENIQSTNWQTVRFKPPPPNSDIGWRTEFRPMEVQLTDFENAAFAVFMVLLTRTIRAFDVNFYIPITKVDENMRRAHSRGSALNQRFYFRKVIHKGQEAGFAAQYDSESREDNAQSYYEEMSINQIMNGDASFPGLIPLVKRYVASVDVDAETSALIDRYLELLSKRASGELMTMASYMRKFVTEHKAYNKDSVLNEEITWDLLQHCMAVVEGREKAPELLGDLYVAPVVGDAELGALLDSLPPARCCEPVHSHASNGVAAADVDDINIDTTPTPAITSQAQ